MWRHRVIVGHETVEPFEGELLARLARKDHEDYPLELLGVGLVGIEGQHALDDDLALLRREYSEALEREEEAAAFGREATQLALGEDAHARGLHSGLRLRQRRPLVPEGEVGEPVERALDLRRRESRALEIAREVLPLRHLRRIGEHVPVEDVDQDVENAASHHLCLRYAAIPAAGKRRHTPLELEYQQHR